VAVSIVNDTELAWVNGRDAYETMEPAFRDNFGGDADQVRELLSKYWMKSLWLDPSTTRRIDHVRTDAGYVDLSEAYHDSVEEGFFRGGDCTLSAEGLMLPGDYFWRPPGWVHKAWTTDGFDTILCMEGEVDSEESGRVSRVICADHEAGEQSRDGADGGIGPRGYVRHGESRYMPWRPVDDAVVGLGGDVEGKVLSSNVDTDACSLVVRAASGWSHRLSAVPRERFLVNTRGDLVADGQELGECSLVRIPPGEQGPELSATSDLELFVKVCEAA
jgi:hypothetical protein